MVKGKDGKMVPDYAADGKGKMKAGGMAKAYKEGGRIHKTMESKDPNSLAAFKKLTEKKPIASKSEAKIAEGKKKPTQKYKEGGEVEKKDKKAEKLKKNKEQAYKQSKKIYEAEESLPEGSIRKKIAGATDKIGDKIRGSSVGKLAKKMGTGTFSRDDEAQMKARKEVKGYKKGGKVRGYGMARGGKVCKMR